MYCREQVFPVETRLKIAAGFDRDCGPTENTL